MEAQVASRYMEPLTRDESRELLLRMRYARLLRPGGTEEHRIRELLAKKDRRVWDMQWHEVVAFAKVVLGGYVVLRLLE